MSQDMKARHLVLSYPVRPCPAVINRPGNLKRSRNKSASSESSVEEEEKESGSIPGTDVAEQGDSSESSCLCQSVYVCLFLFTRCLSFLAQEMMAYDLVLSFLLLH